MSKLEEVDLLTDSELGLLKEVGVKVKGKYYSTYTFSDSWINFPLAKSIADCEIKIIHCQKGKRLKLKLLFHGKPLYIFESSEPVTTISVERK